MVRVQLRIVSIATLAVVVYYVWGLAFSTTSKGTIAVTAAATNYYYSCIILCRERDRPSLSPWPGAPSITIIIIDKDRKR